MATLNNPSRNPKSSRKAVNVCKPESLAGIGKSTNNCGLCRARHTQKTQLECCSNLDEPTFAAFKWNRGKHDTLRSEGARTTPVVSPGQPVSSISQLAYTHLMELYTLRRHKGSRRYP